MKHLAIYYWIILLSVVTSFAQNATTQPATVSLSWNDNSDNESKFILYRAENGNAFKLLSEVPANTITFVDGSVVRGKTYAYRVTAANQYGESAFAQSESVYIPGPPIPPTTIKATYTDQSISKR